MKITPTSLFGSKATALLFALGTAHLVAQTTFTPTSTFANFLTGAAVHDNGTGLGGIASTNTSYALAGTPLNNLTPEIFGQSFTVTANGTSTQGGTAAWGFDGVIGGSAISSLTAMPITYSFDVTKSLGITSNVTWKLYFRGGSFVNNGELLIASGTTSGGAISGSGSYVFTTGATAGEGYRAYLEVDFTSNVAVSPGTIAVTMANTGFGGQGITLNASAIPEPSTYAAIAGAAMLGLAVWQRRRGKSGGAVVIG